jgi:hypothetical protein
VLVTLLLGVTLFAASAASAGTSVVYSRLAGNAPPSNIPSEGPEAYAFNEFGNEITLSGTNRKLSNVVVTMSSWGCVSGAWYSGDCYSPSGSTFSVPITLTVYSINGSGRGSTLGGALATTTQTFSIPYRPSASPQCTGNQAGEWYQSSTRTCFHGYASNITFDFGQNVTLPDTVVVGIAYNTTHYGYSPIGQSVGCFGTAAGCPYDSLNIGLSTDPTDVTVGSDPNTGTLWQNSPYGSQYCDGGLAGTGSFRLDSPTSACWGTGVTGRYYVPAVQVKAGTGKSSG